MEAAVWYFVVVWQTCSLQQLRTREYGAVLCRTQVNWWTTVRSIINFVPLPIDLLAHQIASPEASGLQRLDEVSGRLTPCALRTTNIARRVLHFIAP